MALDHVRAGTTLPNTLENLHEHGCNLVPNILELREQLLHLVARLLGDRKPLTSVSDDDSRLASDFNTSQGQLGHAQFESEDSHPELVDAELLDDCMSSFDSEDTGIGRVDWLCANTIDEVEHLLTELDVAGPVCDSGTGDDDVRVDAFDESTAFSCRRHGVEQISDAVFLRSTAEELGV